MNKKIIIISISIILGIFAMFQARSIIAAPLTFTRDNTLDIFREIQVLKNTNKNLKTEIETLEDTLAKLKNRSSVLKTIEAEIQKDKLISGDAKISGPGIRVTLKNDIDTIWMIDLINELFIGGAEAISINGIRLVNQTMGLDVLPNNQILLNGIILNQPYIFDVIGDNKTLTGLLEQGGGFTARLHEFRPKAEISIEQQKIMTIEKS